MPLSRPALEALGAAERRPDSDSVFAYVLPWNSYDMVLAPPGVLMVSVRLPTTGGALTCLIHR